VAGSSTHGTTLCGGCHCGAVRFEVTVSLGAVTLWRCNCSICHKAGYLHLIVEKRQFRLLQGSERLSSYRFNTGVAEHLFCSVCGIKPFYVPRSHPNGYSVNARCLDNPALMDAPIRPFDGQNGESNAGVLGE
jgi:hypothetical protein